MRALEEAKLFKGVIHGHEHRVAQFPGILSIDGAPLARDRWGETLDGEGDVLHVLAKRRELGIPARIFLEHLW